MRQHIVGDGKPVVSGHIAYRAVLPTADWPKEYRLPKMIIWGGDKTHLVHYPLRRGELFNLVVVFHSDRYEEGWDTYGDPAELHERFAEKCEPVRTLLKKVNSWKMWVLCDRPPIKNWSKGRITLLGDAAHPMLQYLAQGANMAIEDAVCLANQIEAAGGDYAAAFQKYQELRYLRTARVQLMARVYGEVYHANDVDRELRNKVLREWTGAGRRRHVVALRRAAGAAARRQRAAAADHATGILIQQPTIHPGGEPPMAKLDDLLEDLVTANRILAIQGIVDSFGHVSIRHPGQSQALFPVARARAGAGRDSATSWNSRSRAIRSTPRAAGPISSASSTARPTRCGRT